VSIKQAYNKFDPEKATPFDTMKFHASLFEREVKFCLGDRLGATAAKGLRHAKETVELPDAAKFQNQVSKCNSNNPAWNSSSFVIAGAPSWISNDATAQGYKRNGGGYWSSLAYGIGTHAEVIAHFQRRTGEQIPNKTAKGNSASSTAPSNSTVIQDSTVGGGQFRVGTSEFNALAEGLYVQAGTSLVDCRCDHCVDCHHRVRILAIFLQKVDLPATVRPSWLYWFEKECSMEIAMPSTKRLVELAIKGLEFERERIDQELLQLRQRLSGMKGTNQLQRQATKMAAPRQRRKMSAAARKQISKRMREIWAQRRKAA
jgi:hypothetical protein